MSRIGRLPVPLPSTVKAKLEKSTLFVEGPKGKLNFDIHPEMKVAVAEQEIKVTRPTNSKRHRALHGLTRQLINNMVVGVSTGFTKQLSIVGVGYNAKLQKDELVLNIGFCHPIHMPIPAGIELEVPNPTSIIIRGADKQMVGQFTANIRSIRPPEPYKGKGIRYTDEVVHRKAGKAMGS